MRKLKSELLSLFQDEEFEQKILGLEHPYEKITNALFPFLYSTEKPLSDWAKNILAQNTF